MQLSEFVKLMLVETNEDFRREVQMKKLVERLLGKKEENQ